MVPWVPLGEWTPLPELMEDVRDLFMVDSSISDIMPLFRFPGLDEGKESVKFALIQSAYTSQHHQ